MSDVRSSIVGKLQELGGFGHGSPEDFDDGLDKFPKLSYAKLQGDLMAEHESSYEGHNLEMKQYNECYDRYSGNPYMNERPGFSATQNMLIYEKVQWMASTITKIITESDSAYAIAPLGGNNIASAKIGKLVLDDTIGKGADNHIANKDTIVNSFFGNAYMKAHWVPRDDANNIPIAHFGFEAVPPERLYWDHGYSSFYQSPFVNDVEMVPMHEIIDMAEQDGDWMIDELAKALASGGDSRRQDTTQGDTSRKSSTSEHTSDSIQRVGSQATYRMITHWTHYDINQDGGSEKVIAVTIEGALVRFVKINTPDKQHPYMYAQALRDSYSSLGWSMEKLLGHNQYNATMIDRMVINNIASQDNGVVEYDVNHISPMAAKVYKRGVPRSMIPSTKIGSIAPTAQNPLAPQVLAERDAIMNRSDATTGFTKSTNLDIQMLKGTANNANIVNNSGQTRIWDTTKQMIETWYKVMSYKCLAYTGEWMDSESFGRRFGIDLTAAEIKEIFKSPKYKINSNISLSSDDAEVLQQIFNWAQYFSQQAQPGADGQVSDLGQKIGKIMDRMAARSAELMKIPEIEAEVKGEDIIGENGLSITQKQLDDAVGGGVDDGEAVQALNEEGGIGLGDLGGEVPLDGADPLAQGGEDLAGLEGLLGAGGDIPAGEGPVPELL